MSIKAILFDLDGTLLPMDQDRFVKTYFHLLAVKLAPHGYDPKQLVDAVWAGTAAMVKNNGHQSNEAAFWEKFTELLNAGFTDSFRYLYPDKTDAYSWWSYRAAARQRNIGWRIDYFVVSDRLRENIRDAYILPELMGSDHCPVGLDMTW